MFWLRNQEIKNGNRETGRLPFKPGVSSKTGRVDSCGMPVFMDDIAATGKADVVRKGMQNHNLKENDIWTKEN